MIDLADLTKLERKILDYGFSIDREQNEELERKGYVKFKTFRSKKKFWLTEKGFAARAQIRTEEEKQHMTDPTETPQLEVPEHYTVSEYSLVDGQHWHAAAKLLHGASYYTEQEAIAAINDHMVRVGGAEYKRGFQDARTMICGLLETAASEPDQPRAIALTLRAVARGIQSTHAL